MVQYFPPKFARSVSHLTDQKTYLEDSSGRRWRVRVCKRDGSLAIKQGWPEFSSEHGLKLGEFLVFHYVPGKHFIVQIFGTSACEKIKFCSDIGKGRKRARSYPETTNSVELLQTTAMDSARKKLEPGIMATNMVSRPAEDFPLLAEDIPPRGPKYRNSKEALQFRGEYANGNKKVIKSEPADSGDAPSLTAVNYSCLMEIDGRDFLVNLV
ncbi:putative nuclear transcription factor Y subunit C-1-like isoform X1 [Capsicum annuum]|nr:putative nuclear transcription factor Y subunit C-1-like isoform X1 [Capsicum annuum]